MRLLPLLGFCLAFSLACGLGGKDEDDDDDDDDDDLFGDDSGGGGEANIADQGFECSGATCTYWVAADGDIDDAEVDVIENGEPSWECGPNPPPPDVVCGVWHEAHNAFVVSEADNEYGGVTLEIVLAAEDYYADQVDNESTLFAEEYLGQMSALFLVSSGGTTVDCVAVGYDPDYYTSDCANIGGDW